MAKCIKCGDEKVSDKVKEFSEKNFGKILCFKCQKTERATKEPAKSEVPPKPVINEERVVEAPYSKTDYWADKAKREIERGRQISRHGALNTAVEILKLKYGSSAEVNMLTIQDIATEVLLWVNKK